jgi:hypothetical protein
MSTKTIIPKRSGFGLEAKTFKGKSGQTYLVFRTLGGGFHVFVEVEAKEAGTDCGGGRQGTRLEWQKLWKKAK